MPAYRGLPGRLVIGTVPLTLMRHPPATLTLAAALLLLPAAGGRIAASWGRGARRRALEERVALPKGTYWGPLIFIVLKNFDANAEDGRLVFRTVAPTPRPRVFDMELAGGPPAALQRVGTRLATRRFQLGPTLHWKRRVARRVPTR